MLNPSFRRPFAFAAWTVLISSPLFGCSSGSPNATARPENGAGGGSPDNPDASVDTSRGTGATRNADPRANAGGSGGGGGISSRGAAGILDTIDICTGVLCPAVTQPGCETIGVTIRSRRILTEDVPTTDCKPTVIDWTTPVSDAGADVKTPPPEETYSCPADQVRVHVRDIWSTRASPSLGKLTDRPLGVLVINPVANWLQYGARQESEDCGWYSTCVPKTITQIQLKPIGADSCQSGNASGNIDLSKLAKTSPDIWLDYGGTSATIAADYGAYPNANVGDKQFRMTSDKTKIESELCERGNPDQSIPSGFTKIHFRWPWGDPNETGYPGSACADQKLGFDTPPYPSSLKVTGGACEMQAMLEFQDGKCPWYYLLVPNSQWPTDPTKPLKLAFRYPNDAVGLWTPGLELPAREASEYWIGYAGAVDNTAASNPVCMDWSQQPNSFFFYTQNPGPGYEQCGGGPGGTFDPCSPPVPTGYHTVHFRYIWAGQKTFTFFPNPKLMPRWIELEVSSNKVICFREQDRPWYNCPIPDSYFKAGATWRAVDKTHDPEWNTVAPREFPTTPKDYWLRWDYGKPDIPPTSRFKFFDYYPDGTNGDWSATGDWKDESCAPKPPATPVKVGFDFGGWFPYTRTKFAYPFGASLAHVYSDSAKVQDLLNAFVYQRYIIWRDNYVTTDDLACGPDTARVKTDPPETVSEGQAYGIAISAAIGDKPTFTKLWNFARHFLSQSAKKYCGGLLGWMWDGHIACRQLDTPCDPDSGQCSGQEDSAFDGDVDIGIGLVFAARQWPEYTEAAINWLLKMECEVNGQYDSQWKFPTPGDTWDKNCAGYPDQPCSYGVGNEGQVNMSYYPPGYFRVFGDFLATSLSPEQYSQEQRDGHRSFWYKTAETVYEMLERCYDQKDVHPGLVSDWGRYSTPCSIPGGNYDWSRALWRVGIDAAWFGNRTDLPENKPGSSPHYPKKSRMQAKIDNIQAYYSDFYKKNPPEPNANRFSTICQDLVPAGTAAGCDPALGHNSYFVNTAMCSFASVFDNGGATTADIRREALEEAVSTTVENDRYYQESIGVYTMLFLSGNFPNPMIVP